MDRNPAETTIAYEDPDEGTVERTVRSEHVAYARDHWIVKTGEDDSGRDVVRRIPRDRVHYVERSVEAVEREVTTLRGQVQSLADELRSKVAGGAERRDRGEVHRIDIEEADETPERSE